MMLACASLFFLAGCNEQKNAVEKAPEAKAQAAQPVAQPAPEQKTFVPKADFKSVTWEQAIEMNKAGAIYVDVRNPDELATGFAPFAVNIPLGEIKTRFAELPKDKDLLVYCRSGRRSELATHFLVKNGYDRAYNVYGGFLAFPKNN